MTCTTVVISGTGDKYYDCVSGKCTEKAGGIYKNDPTCAGKCIPASPPVTPGSKIDLYVLIGAAVLGAIILYGRRRR